MTAKQISKQFTQGLVNLGLSNEQVMGVVRLATDLLRTSIPYEPIAKVEQRATEVIEEK